MKYYIKTFGCQMNISDSERIAGFLERPHPSPLLSKEREFRPAKNISEADLVVFNTCGVRQMAEDRVYGQIHNLRKNNSKVKIVLTGCLANRKDVQRKLKNKVNLFCEIKDFTKKILSVIARNKATKQSRNKKTRSPRFARDDNYLEIIPKYTDKHTAFVPIMTGCNNFCSYCVVPYARGREISRSEKDIVQEIEKLSQDGCREITLLGQNVNSYEYKNYDFPKLLNHLTQSFPKINFRFLTSHPKDFSEKLMQVIAKNKNISREIHLPIQSGSNKILKLMNRPYTQKHYLDLIKKAEMIIPGVSFTTDVIVGFPGETKKDFEETAKVFKKVKYNEAYINKYSPRPGTVAYKLNDNISWEEKKKREKILREILKKYPE